MPLNCAENLKRKFGSRSQGYKFISSCQMTFRPFKCCLSRRVKWMHTYKEKNRNYKRAILFHTQETN
ncbi:hypothetical protein PRUPE_2G094000 [Prunus persica]|uniref:Uncharacterized protein n=1 Tax=Prunus persica TaxID=3760 RepID=A0A251QDG3_PRUPE|nr:hypothetical protein PRUPE_2G094000 [Prunus persica]